MKKKLLYFNYIILFIFCQFISGCLVFGDTRVFAVDTNNFYFESFEGDYYLSKDIDGVSSLKVVENLTAVFPDYKQNKGICREIPFTNQGGANITLPYLTKSDITIKRNGAAEPIYSIKKYSDYYEVCTGTDDYLMGEQTYTFEYEFEKVVTDFGDYQELYWDTNGNGWQQKFNSVIARVHFVGQEVEEAFTGESWCYVGRYGESDDGRCKISEIDDGIEFSAVNLLRGENLTFDVEIESGVFVVPEPEKNYFLLWCLGGVLIICLLFLISPIKKFIKTKDKIKYYKEYFVKPEYQPSKDYSLAEMAEIFIGKKKDSKVGILLNMIVKKRITLVKKQSKIFGSEKWTIVVNDVDDASTEELIILAILNGGDEVEKGDTIVLRTRPADTMTVKLGKKFKSVVLARLKKDKLVESDYKISNATSKALAPATMIWFIFVLFSIFPVLIGLVESIEGISAVFLGELVGKEYFVPVLLVMIIATTVMRKILKTRTKTFGGHTLKGLEASRYMDGLKLYIKMAEAERLKMLQSVEGADVSKEGIVKLYEKLLPYAAVFGLEKSWMQELEKYYQADELIQPDWYRSGLTTADLLLTTRMAAGYVNTSSTYVSRGSISGGGGSSSSFSGGSGGGFSGGGGGGGGGGGR